MHTVDDTAPILRLSLRGEAATGALAAWIAPRLQAGWRLYLSGELAAGKTRFAQRLLASLGHHGRVRSPTFTLVEPYNLSRFDLYHFDLYRLTNENDWQETGFDEILSDAAIVSVVEWPERADTRLPPADLRLHLSITGDDEPPTDPDDFDDDAGRDGNRIAELLAGTERGRACLIALACEATAGRLAGVCCGPAPA
jgi:tRNA threonylcarbamoyladenosine biosynthesis protein TsaE